MVTLADLVYAGRIDDALVVAKDLNPRAVYEALFLADERFLADVDSPDVFVRAWYDTLGSPYLRAEAAHEFADVYLTELAPVPNAEFIGANMKTEAFRALLQTVAKACLGYEVNEWEETPEHPLPEASARKWRAVGFALDSLDFPPAVPVVAPPEA